MNSLSVPTPRVPLDIQLAIVEMCPDVQTRLTLVSTHKELRRHGARLALRLRSAQVRLHTESAARSFFAFCSAQGIPREPSSPLALLHTLDITLATVNPADIGSLITTLANVPRLTSLTLRDPEKTLLRQSSLYVVLRYLQTLKTLRLDQAGPIAYKLVSEIASALEAITIVPRRSPHLDSGDDAALYLNTVLARHIDTLTHVFAGDATVLADEDEFEGDLVVFDKVRHLEIPASIMAGAADYIRAFPNVVSLNVGTCLTTHTKRWSKTLVEIHNENLVDLLLDDEDGGGMLAWRSLKRVRGGLWDLYVFGHICPVDVLEFDGLIKDDWEYVPSVVKFYFPRLLRLSVSPSLRVDLWEKHRTKLRHVRRLVLRFVVEDLIGLEQLTDTAVRAAGSFLGCSTVFLDFVGQNDAARGRLQDVDHESLVRSIVEESRSGASEIGVRSPGRISYWRCCRNSIDPEDWEFLNVQPIGINVEKVVLETEGHFPAEHVSDWL